MTAAELPALRPGATLLHIGLPKTGTTAVQGAASQLRGALLEQGVCYPGRSLNHGTASNALMGRSTAVFEAGPRTRWDRIAREVRGHPGAIGWVSYEQIVQSSPEVARRFLDELGPDLHVVVTARSYVSLFASAWQQWIKDAGDLPFDTWLEAVLAARGAVPGEDPTAVFWRQYDLPAIARTWAEVVGPDRVTVVLLDKRTPEVLFDTFEALLGLRSGTLAEAPGDALLSNRGMSLAEAELVRGVNARMRAGRAPVSRRHYYRVMRNGAVSTVLRDRVPRAEEGRIAVPVELATRIAAVGAEAAGDLGRLGVTVVGDPAVLAEVPADAPARVPHAASTVDPALAALAVVGATSAALGEGVNFAGGRRWEAATSDPAPRPSRRAALGELRRRLRAAVVR